MPRKRSVATLVAAGTLATVAGCTAGPSIRPAVVTNEGPVPPGQTSQTGPPPPPPLRPPSSNSVQWNTCDSVITGRFATPLPAGVEVECARMSSVLDSPYAPGRGTTRLTLLKAGNGPVPVVVVNDVDGLPGTAFAALLAAKLPRDMLDRISLVGMDRRGTGSSEPVRCVPEEIRATLLDNDPARLDMEPVLDAARRAGQQCVINLDNRLPAIDTWRTASDLEKLRNDLGMPHLHAIGRGEGSRVLTTYAERYPRTVGRMVLDGHPDPSADRMIALEPVPAGLEATFSAFAAACVTKGGCPLGPDPRGAVTALLESLRARPLPIDEERSITAGTVLGILRQQLAEPEQWPQLAAALAKTRAGDASGLSAAATTMVDDVRGQPPKLDIGLVTGCNDTSSRLPPERFNAAAKTWQTQSPLFGALVAQELVVCSPWPVPTQAVPTPSAKGTPPIVMLATAADPVTPQVGTERTAGRLSSTSTVTWHGTGHGALTRSSCATDAARAFLLDGQVPRNGLVCPP
ncbi:TAP-like protein [Herbihabitans rhizosphaerae]|uniref:TAP-like protein n=1 Tax=Herbihabitans rhizosphaerae TaxID=1872711 RepID=A0A4V2EU79_9PSEU|nr:TAP-like protein [Herbihabitans rhizosphaerae]